jgi:hypothetical protein
LLQENRGNREYMRYVNLYSNKNRSELEEQEYKELSKTWSFDQKLPGQEPDGSVQRIRSQKTEERGK